LGQATVDHDARNGPAITLALAYYDNSGATFDNDESGPVLSKVVAAPVKVVGLSHPEAHDLEPSLELDAPSTIGPEESAHHTANTAELVTGPLTIEPIVHSQGELPRSEHSTLARPQCTADLLRNFKIMFAMLSKHPSRNLLLQLLQVSTIL